MHPDLLAGFVPYALLSADITIAIWSLAMFDAWNLCKTPELSQHIPTYPHHIPLVGKYPHWLANNPAGISHGPRGHMGVVIEAEMGTPFRTAWWSKDLPMKNWWKIGILQWMIYLYLYIPWPSKPIKRKVVRSLPLFGGNALRLQSGPSARYHSLVFEMEFHDVVELVRFRPFWPMWLCKGHSHRWRCSIGRWTIGTIGSIGRLKASINERYPFQIEKKFWYCTCFSDLRFNQHVAGRLSKKRGWPSKHADGKC